MEKVLEVVNKGNYISQYEDLVSRYPKAMYSAIDSLSLLTFLIPGRFGDAEIIEELYILCNLLQLYHGRILDGDRQDWRSILGMASFLNSGTRGRGAG